jgi:hypothetical protein
LLPLEYSSLERMVTLIRRSSYWIYQRVSKSDDHGIAAVSGVGGRQLMAPYDAEENISRLRRGMVALLGGRSIDFEKSGATLVVVFDGAPSRYSNGRVVLFQDFFDANLGIVPQVVRQVPACIKVFFNTEPASTKAVSDLLQSAAFRTLCHDLHISQVQFGVKMFLPPTAIK